MSDYLRRLNLIKAYIEKKQRNEAIHELEDLLCLLKVDYLSGKDKDRTKAAFNKLVRVRKELLSGVIGDETRKLLHKDVVKTTPVVEKPLPFEDEPIVEEKPLPVKEEPKKEEPIVEAKAETKEDESLSPEETVLEDAESKEFMFEWEEIPTVSFDDIAGLEDVKDTVRRKVLNPINNPDSMIGYVHKGGGGVTLYGPPGTGKTMIAAATANAIHAKFCSIVPSQILQTGVGNSEKAIKTLFAEARRFPCAMIYFDEFDALAPKNTRSTIARNIRSEFLAQIEGISSYGKATGNILFLMCATNKPWDVDSAFLRPGRFGTKIYVGLPDEEARAYIINHFLDKIRKEGIVKVEDIDVPYLVNATNGFNGSDMNNLNVEVEEISRDRSNETGEKKITNEDYKYVVSRMWSSVQPEDIEKLMAWKKINDVYYDNKKEDEPSKPVEEQAVVEETSAVVEEQPIVEETPVQEEKTSFEEIVEEEPKKEVVNEEVTAVENNAVEENAPVGDEVASGDGFDSVE